MWSRIAIALLSFVAVHHVAAQPFYPGQQSDRPSVSTSGSAEVRVVPDQVEVAVGVESVHRDLQTAHRMNEETVAKMMELAKKHGIAADGIQTDFVNIEPEYTDSRTAPVKYTVRRSMVITSKNVGRFDDLLAALVGAGANHVHSIRFSTTRLREHRDEARRMATRAAFEKARLLAETLGAKVGKVRHIAESSDSWSSSYGSWWGRWGGSYQNASMNAATTAGSSSDEGSLAAGRISVTANVNVTFELD
jgi:uncharacterized protein